jgi:hypothetical protein
MSRITVLSPLGVIRAKADPLAVRLPSLDGVTLGVLTNNKPNVNLLADRLAELLSSRYNIHGVLRKRKANPAVPATALDRLAGDCKAVIVAVGD